MKNNRKTIAFGVAGEGLGHAARTIALSELLQEYYKIVVFAPSTISGFISKKLENVRIIEIPAISFYKENHVIRYRKTLLMNLTNIGRLHPEVKRLTGCMSELDIDAVVSDFEPYTAIAGTTLNLPVLNLNHPGVVLKYFSLKPDALAAKITARIMMPSGTQELICSFYGGDIGPIIRKEIRTVKPHKGDYYIVYTKNESRDAVLKALGNFPESEFRVFPDSKTDFISSLAGCRGVISSGGHQMLSEALYLKKPVLAFPQKMQFEQRLNAIMLENSGWGIHGDIGKIEASVDQFIKTIDRFPFGSTPNDNFLFNDFSIAAANCIRDFIEQNDPARTVKQIGNLSFRKNRPVRIKSA